jgi:hypothetical protein
MKMIYTTRKSHSTVSSWHAGKLSFTQVLPLMRSDCALHKVTAHPSLLWVRLCIRNVKVDHQRSGDDGFDFLLALEVRNNRSDTFCIPLLWANYHDLFFYHDWLPTPGRPQPRWWADFQLKTCLWKFIAPKNAVDTTCGGSNLLLTKQHKIDGMSMFFDSLIVWIS